MSKDKTAGKRIRDRRIELNLTIEDLAEMMGLSTGFVGLVERGERFVISKNLIKLSDILGVSTDYILKGNGEVLNSNSFNERLATLAKSAISEDEAGFLIEIHRILRRYGYKPGELQYLCRIITSFLMYTGKEI